MKKLMPALFSLALVALAGGCGGSSSEAEEPEPAPAAAATADAEAAVETPVGSVEAEAHLHIAPFELVMTSSNKSGEVQKFVISGDAEGNLTAKQVDAESGETTGEQKVGKVHADGRLVAAGSEEAIIQLHADGRVSLGEADSAIRIGEDGTIEKDGEPMLELDGSAVVDVTAEGGLLDSTASVAGEVTSESEGKKSEDKKSENKKPENKIEYEGTDETRRLIALVLTASLAANPSKVEGSSEAEATTAPKPAPSK